MRIPGPSGLAFLGLVLLICEVGEGIKSVIDRIKLLGLSSANVTAGDFNSDEEEMGEGLKGPSEGPRGSALASALHAGQGVAGCG